MLIVQFVPLKCETNTNTMIDTIAYTTAVCFFLIVISYAIIRYKYGFWVEQPVFHIYDWKYAIWPPGIIRETLPPKNRYVNLTNIHTLTFSQLTDYHKSQFVRFIQSHYLRNRENVFCPTEKQVLPYFQSHPHDPPFLSFYEEEDTFIDAKTNHFTHLPRIVGIITSRPVTIAIRSSIKDESPHAFNAYYVDYLCVHPHRRKSGLAPQLIQTHYYHQRIKNPSIAVSLFKREDELTGIVPLCAYSTYGFPAYRWTQPENLSGEYKYLKIGAQNYRFFLDFMKSVHASFDIWIMSDHANVLELIRTENIHICAVICDEQIVASYFFRKSCVEIEKDIEVLSCFASICKCEESIFIRGFKVSFWEIASKYRFSYCAIERISNNGVIIDNLRQKTMPNIISPTAYYFYNFAYPTFASDRVFILN